VGLVVPEIRSLEWSTSALTSGPIFLAGRLPALDNAAATVDATPLLGANVAFVEATLAAVAVPLLVIDNTIALIAKNAPRVIRRSLMQPLGLVQAAHRRKELLDGEGMWVGGKTKSS
jgi:hypothetical protein